MNQKGFATLEIILMVMVVGILATMAVPQFEKVTASANTAKVQSDLAAINSAAAIYQMETGNSIKNLDISTLSSYFENGVPQPPTGKIYIEGSVKDAEGSYGTDENGKATLGGKTADEFTMKTSTSSGTGS